MGDRGNIVIEEDGKRIFFYTHWRGHELPAILQTALARRQRWNDPSYLARIIFSEMIKGSEGGETGFGISLSPADNQYPYLCVDSKKQTITVDYTPENERLPNKTFTFQEFSVMQNPTWMSLRDPADRESEEDE